MARKRMFDIEIINQDSFLDLPSEAIALYFLLGMNADDEGFVTPKKVMRLYNISNDTLKVLISKNYLIPFESGVVVITDWKRNNYLNQNRIIETLYKDEKDLLYYDDETQKYQVLNQCLTNVKPMLNQNSIEQNRIEENRRVQNRIDYNNIVEIYNDLCFNLPKILKLTEKRKKNISKFLKEFSIDDFKNICIIANNNDFLTGNNDRNWKADFDFLLRSDKATAILENKYTKKKDKLDGFKDLWKEAVIEDEQTGNSTINNSFSW